MSEHMSIDAWQQIIQLLRYQVRPLLEEAEDHTHTEGFGCQRQYEMESLYEAVNDLIVACQYHLGREMSVQDSWQTHSKVEEHVENTLKKAKNKLSW